MGASSDDDEEEVSPPAAGEGADVGREDAAWISPTPNTTVTIKQGIKTTIWTVVNVDAAGDMAKLKDTSAKRPAARTLHVGLVDG